MRRGKAAPSQEALMCQTCDWSHRERGIYGVIPFLLTWYMGTRCHCHTEVCFRICGRPQRTCFYLKDVLRKESKVHPFFLGCFSYSHSQELLKAEILLVTSRGNSPSWIPQQLAPDWFAIKNPKPLMHQGITAINSYKPQ